MDGLSDAAAEVRERLQRAARVAVLTGAGVSAESGLATFRSGPDALWRRHRPEDLATPEAFARDPELVWSWYRHRLQRAAAAAPNAGHFALATLQSTRPTFRLITQNVDGLHERAGSRSVIELHGNIWRSRCTVCPRSVPTPLDDALPPRCACGALLRPDVVWFGEALPARAMQRALDAAGSADFFIVAGTSALVYPAAGLVGVARAGGAFIVEVNPEETPATVACDVSVRAKSGEFLPLLC